MLKRLTLMAVILSCSIAAHAANWQEGVNYFLIQPAQYHWMPKPGKVEVTEVFSYACPACNAFWRTADKLKASLPPQAIMTYLPASFIPQEDWPMFQQAWCTAHTLGIARQTHDDMFKAVWNTGQLATEDPATHQLRQHLPTIQDAAKYYHQLTNVPVQKFLDTANSFTVNTLQNRANKLVMAWQVSGTPTIVIDGKYRVTVASAGGRQQIIELVDYLVKKEAAAMKTAASQG